MEEQSTTRAKGEAQPRLTPAGNRDEALDRVRRFREAAHIAVTEPSKRKATIFLTLIDLADMARNEPDPVVRTWAGEAIWREAIPLLGDASEELGYPPDAYERAQRALRAKGYVRCPECASELATDLDFERWKRRRAAHVRELETRDRAVER